jgi:hypothetical protein
MSTRTAVSSPRLLLLAVVAASSLVGCVLDPHPKCGDAFHVQGEAHVSAGSAVTTLAGVPLESRLSQFDRYGGTPSTHCTFDFSQNGMSIDGKLPPLEGGMFIRCVRPDGAKFEVFQRLDDLRTMGAGSRTFSRKNDLFVDYLPSECAGGSCRPCRYRFDDAVVTITVDAAGGGFAGGLAGGGDLVTRDFRRLVHVQFTTATATPTAFEGTCDADFGIAVDASFEQTAADYETSLSSMYCD